MPQSFNIVGTVVATVIAAFAMPFVFAVASAEHLATSTRWRARRR